MRSTIAGENTTPLTSMSSPDSLYGKGRAPTTLPLVWAQKLVKPTSRIPHLWGLPEHLKNCSRRGGIKRPCGFNEWRFWKFVLQVKWRAGGNNVAVRRRSYNKVLALVGPFLCGFSCECLHRLRSKSVSNAKDLQPVLSYCGLALFNPCLTYCQSLLDLTP